MGGIGGEKRGRGEEKGNVKWEDIAGREINKRNEEMLMIEVE